MLKKLWNSLNACFITTKYTVQFIGMLLQERKDFIENERKKKKL